MVLYQIGSLDLFGIIFFSVFALLALCVVGLIGRVVVKSLRASAKQRAMPIESKPATVVAKRTITSGGGNFSVSTACYATFEFENGERLELAVDIKPYGLLVEGDTGNLVYQGAACKDFTRTIDDHSADDAESPARTAAEASHQVPTDNA